MKKKIIIVVLLFLIISGVAYFFTHKKQNLEELTLYGNIEIRQVDLGFQVGGKLDKMLKEEGDSVQKGELIAEIDPKDYVLNLQKAQAETAKTLALKNDAVSKFNRHAPLVKGNAISKEEYDSFKNAKDKSLADYDSALVAQHYAQNQLEYTKLYAPEDGIVMIRVQEPGSIINAGQIVYSISKTKPVWIRAYVNEIDLGNITYGQKAKITIDSINPQTRKEREYTGYIGYISPVAEFTPKTVQTTDLRTDLVYRIRVYIDDIDEYLRQGMPTTIKLDLKAQNERHRD